MKTIRVLYFIVFQIFFFLIFARVVLAEETGYRIPTSCVTDGSSCENMMHDDELYNFWDDTYHEEVVATFTDFGVPEEAIIDEIQVKMLIKASQSGWTWTTQFSWDGGLTYLFPFNCILLGGKCQFNPTTSFNTLNFYSQNYTLRWINSYYDDRYITGEEFNSPLFKFKLVQESGFKDVYIDTVRFNIVYHRSEVIEPQAFLELPWDYGSKGLTFTDAAMAINSYFDHAYPLLSTSLSESEIASGSVTTYLGEVSSTISYSSHDGYDYGKKAKATLGEAVLAAASGSAKYINSCKLCGNSVYIDHGNGFQTRYYHLLKDGLISTVSGEIVHVEAGQEIGKVGSTGNSTGAHIHFMVVQDKNDDGDFDDNIPDGLLDPFGWQSKDPDPWPNYNFFYKEADRSGSKSYYLWKRKLDKATKTIGIGGGSVAAGRFSIDVLPDTTGNTKFNLQSAPQSEASATLVSVGSTVNITAEDLSGNSVTQFSNPIKVKVDFSQQDISRYDLSTFSIYSSSDRLIWNKENTYIDSINKYASTDVDHLTYFALMAERLDTATPVTEAVLDGSEGSENWFRSDVEVRLNAYDGEGLGVDYTLYRLSDGDWEIYSQPLYFNSEGEHSVEFYSVDSDDNKEDVKKVEFYIDKTPPTVWIDADPKILWPPNGDMHDILITGESDDDNLVATIFIVDDEYDLVEPVLSNFGQTIQLQAGRSGNDKDGRVYIVRAVVEDRAGNTVETSVGVVIPHDLGD